MAETIRTPVFTRYEMLERIGSGSMGAVYKAHDARLDRWVALKVLPPGLRDDEEALERFKREARVLAQLKHPGVASVYDADAQNDFPYLVMEFVEGPNLERMLRERSPLTVDEAIRLGIEIAEALEHIHCHRIIHRDIKTSNIIIGPEGRAVLADFGIAYVASLPRISQGALGTPEYMSPEQADGRPMDGRSDIYSVGAVLYECLTGQVPFQQEGEGFAALTHLMQRVLQEPVTPIQTHRPEVPAWLAEVVERCLAKDPEERYTRATELVAALQPGHPEVVEVAVDATPEKAEPQDATLLQQTITLISHVEPVEGVAFSTNGKWLASAAKDKAIRIWDVKTGQLLHLMKGPSAQSVAFSPNNAHLASGNVDGAVRIWDVKRAEQLHELKAHTGYVMSVAYSRNGLYLASGAMDGAVHVWHARTGRLFRTLEQHTGYILSVSFSPDGEHLASGGGDGAVRIWEVKTGNLLHRLKGHAGYVPSVSFSADGKRLASGSVDGTVRIWEVESGRLLHKLKGHTDWVMSVTFSEDGTYLATAGRDQTVRLWETGTGRRLHKLRGHTGAIMSLAFSPDGKNLASGSSDHTVRLWHFGPRDLRKRRSLKGMVWSALVLAVIALNLWAETPQRIKQGVSSLFERPAVVQQEEQPPPATAEPQTVTRNPETKPPRERGLFDFFSNDTANDDGLVEAAEMETIVPARSTSPRRALYSRGGVNLNREGWTLVASVESSRRAAEQVADSLREEGFRVSVIRMLFDGQFSYRVVVGQFSIQAQAATVRKELAGNGLPFDTWLMRIRPEN